MEMESEDVLYEEDVLLQEGDEDGNFLNENDDQDLTGVDVDKLLGDEDEDHTMGASVDEVSENNEVVHAEETEDTEDSQENSETMEEESTESYVRNNFSLNDVFLAVLVVVERLVLYCKYDPPCLPRHCQIDKSGSHCRTLEDAEATEADSDRLDHDSFLG